MFPACTYVESYIVCKYSKFSKYRDVHATSTYSVPIKYT